MTTTGVNPPNLNARPQSLCGYDIVDIIGEGAGSIIYAVTDPGSNQLYALKHVIRKNEKDIRFIDQLETEFQVSQSFTHPGLRKSFSMKINRTLMRKVTEGYLVMELFDGQPLEMNLPNSLRSIVECFVQAAKALEALHQAGIVHCDLKPNNILVSSDRRVKVIDFGQACPVGTSKARIQGTPDYIAPEQVRCEPVTHRTDVFNFGATLYWALTLRKLPTLFTLKKTENSFLFDDAMTTPSAINPQIPEGLSSFVMECVRTNPTKRPADMGEVSRRLELMLHAIARRDGLSSASVA